MLWSPENKKETKPVEREDSEAERSLAVGWLASDRLSGEGAKSALACLRKLEGDRIDKLEHGDQREGRSVREN